jgi:hypothetical protein
MSNARKLFRLFKYLNEYVKSKAIMKDQAMPQFDKILALAIRLAFACYWWYDNLVVLVKIKFFNSIDLKNVSLMASRFWCLALVLTAWDCVRKMIKFSKKDSELRKEKDK